MTLRQALATLIVLPLLAAVPARAADAVAPRPGFEKIGHIVVIYEENRSFDNLYGKFPGADGLANSAATATQVDKDGKPYDQLPPVMNTNTKPAAVDDRFPKNLPNAPFDATGMVAMDQMTGDLVHRFYQEQAQIDGGKMDRFALVSDAGGLVMSYYDGSGLPLWAYAQKYVLADHFFHAAFGGSFLNHFWLICACSPRYDGATPDLVATVDADGHMVKDGVVTPDFYAVNTIQPRFMPHAAKYNATPALLLPPQAMPTIGDRLSEKGVSWAWYSGGWDDALAGHPDKRFQFHHQPFAYFVNFGDGTKAKAEHLKDEKAMMADIAAGTLPAVTFYKPIGAENEHPGYTDVLTGDRHAAAIIAAIEKSPFWSDTVIIVTYDENGGLWDHVAPPKVDRWGPGTRVPTIIISPLAKRGFVDHTVYDTTSILKLIETRYGLVPLGEHDAAAADLGNAFAF